MYLLIDWGNSRLKYLTVEALCQEAIKAAEQNVCFPESLNSFNEALCLINSTNKVSQALIASVRSEGENKRLEKVLHSKGIAPFFAHYDSKVFSANKNLSRKTHYLDPRKMGVDRWLGLLAADKGNKPVGVIDLGSAITVDLLDEEGNHLGGHILPGLKMLKSSLCKTDRISIDHRDSSLNHYINNRLKGDHSLLLGDSTSNCINAGIVHLLAGYLKDLVDGSFMDYQIEKWFIIGGDAAVAQQLLSSIQTTAFKPVFIYSNILIFQGLTKYFLMCKSNS